MNTKKRSSATAMIDRLNPQPKADIVTSWTSAYCLNGMVQSLAEVSIFVTLDQLPE